MTSFEIKRKNKEEYPIYTHVAYQWARGCKEEWETFPMIITQDTTSEELKEYIKRKYNYDSVKIYALSEISKAHFRHLQNKYRDKMKASIEEGYSER
jgi:uncharacterized protein involved in tolerance to divalent cations